MFYSLIESAKMNGPCLRPPTVAAIEAGAVV